MSTDIQPIIDEIKKRANWKMWGLGLGAALLLGPIAWFLASALLGIAAAGVSAAIAGAVVLTVINVAPWFTMKMANTRIALIIAEAQRNPIPTLWEGWRRDGEELAQYNASITEYEGEIHAVEAKMQKLTKNLTPEDIASFERDLVVLRQDLTLQIQDYDDALRQHGLHELEINRASAIWDMTMAMNKANAKNLNLAQTAMEKIKKDTALDAVSKSMGRSKAQLGARIRARANVANAGPGTPALSHNPSPVIDIVTTVSREAFSRKEA